MGRVRKFIKSESFEGKFDDVERSLQRMSSRVFSSATVVMPPIPISIAISKVPEDGEIFRGMFRVSGHLSEILAICEEVKKDSKPSIRVSVTTTDNMKTSISMPIKKGLARLETEFPIPAASRVLIDIDEPDGIKGLWMSALYDMDVLAAAKEALAIDTLVDQMESVESREL